MMKGSLATLNLSGGANTNQDFTINQSDKSIVHLILVKKTFTKPILAQRLHTGLVNVNHGCHKTKIVDYNI